MKTLFYGYGYRDTKSWSCPVCNNYHTSGMDLSVDENRRVHESLCGAECTSCGQKLSLSKTFDGSAHFCKDRWVLLKREMTVEPARQAIPPLDTNSFHRGFQAAKSNLESLARAALKQGWTSADSLVKLLFGEEKS